MLPFFALLTVLSQLVLVSAQQVYYFSGAIQVWAANGQSYNGYQAVPGQCPADHSVNCANVGAQGWCCPANSYCQWYNGQVACCAYGQTCTAYSSPSGPQGAVVGGNAGGATTVTQYVNTLPQTQVVTATRQAVSTGYCSTLYMTGPGLPTTATAGCGVILVTAPSSGYISLVIDGQLVVAVVTGYLLAWMMI